MTHSQPAVDFEPLADKMADKNSKARIARARKLLILNWSHPPGLNRRPADYETFRSTQITENTVHRPSFAPRSKRVVAQVEQVSEQVAAPVPFPTTTTAEVEQDRRPRAWEGTQIKRTAVSMISSIRPQALRGES